LAPAIYNVESSVAIHTHTYSNNRNLSLQTTPEQAAYSSRTLSLYDLVVLGISNRWL